MNEHARIDVHHHVIPPDRRRAIADRAAALGWPVPAWDRRSAIAMMDRRSIATGILSYAAPLGAPDDLEGARATARNVNEFTAELVKDRPDWFGNFAVLPLPDVDGALAEAAHALDELGADGVMVLSNAHGRYLGDAEFEPLWAELDARAASCRTPRTASRPPPGCVRAPLPRTSWPSCGASTSTPRSARPRIAALAPGLRRARTRPVRQRLPHGARGVVQRLRRRAGPLPALGGRAAPVDQPRQRRAPLPRLVRA